MVIKKLILAKYKRFSLNSIDYLEYTPEQKIQLILGTNGAGKSSLLCELSPLPAEHKSFHKGGYKHIFIEYRGSQYELQNEFLVNGNRYNFIKDDVELNKGGTITVYKDLVQQEFGITQEIYDLLSGHESFHAMTPIQRRKWLTLLSDSDYTYAFMYYNKLREKLKDLQNLYKLNQSRLVQEKDKLLSDEQETQYRSDIQSLKDFISQLIELKQPLVEVSKEQELTNKATITEETQRLLTLLPQLTLRQTTVSVIDQEIIEHKAREQACQGQTVQIFNAIQSLEDHVSVLEHTALQSYESIDQQIDDLSLKIHQFTQQKRLGLIFDCPTTALNALNTIYEQLTQIFSELPDNSDHQYSTTRYEQLDRQYRDIELLIAQTDAKILERLKLKGDLDHAKEHQHQQCPKCSHVWYKGYTQETYDAVVKSLSELEQQMDRLRQQQQSLNNSLEAHRSRLSLIQQFRLLSYHWSILEPLWASMAEYDMVSNNPRRVISHVSDLMLDLQLDSQIVSLQKQVTELIKLKDMTNAHQELDVNKVKQQIEHYQKQLQTLSDQIKQAKQQLLMLEGQKKIILQCQASQQLLEVSLEQRDSLGQKRMVALKQQALNDTIRVLQLALNEKEQLISKIDVQKGIIEHLESTLVEFDTKQSLLKIAIKELSPTEGLIAKGLTSFINHFVKHINAFIKQIWLYPLELVPILPDENADVELDYRFKVLVNETNEIPDITKGSAAMREVIDLAFRLVSMSFLKLQDFPIVTDEFASSLDKAHRQAAFHVISDLFSQASFSQIFMVSHYEEMYGSLSNADVNVLCPSNIPLPQNAVINKCLIMRSE